MVLLSLKDIKPVNYDLMVELVGFSLQKLYANMEVSTVYETEIINRYRGEMEGLDLFILLRHLLRGQGVEVVRCDLLREAGLADCSVSTLGCGGIWL